MIWVKAWETVLEHSWNNKLLYTWPLVSFWVKDHQNPCIGGGGKIKDCLPRQ